MRACSFAWDYASRSVWSQPEHGSARVPTTRTPNRRKRPSRTQQEHLAQGRRALPDGDAALDQEAADLIDRSGALADEARSHAMQRQQIHLSRRLDRLDYDLWLDRLLAQADNPDLSRGGAGYVDASFGIP